MSDELQNIPTCTIAPPLRCWHVRRSSPLQTCSAPATWKRAGRHWFEVGYFCDEHKLETDVPIAGVRVFRRVRLEFDVLVSATTTSDVHGKAEALDVIRRAIEHAGGVVDLHSVRSSWVKWAPSAPAAGEPAE